MDPRNPNPCCSRVTVFLSTYYVLSPMLSAHYVLRTVPSTHYVLSTVLRILHRLYTQVSKGRKNFAHSNGWAHAGQTRRSPRTPKLTWEGSCQGVTCIHNSVNLHWHANTIAAIGAGQVCSWVLAALRGCGKKKSHHLESQTHRCNDPFHIYPSPLGFKLHKAADCICLQHTQDIINME